MKNDKEIIKDLLQRLNELEKEHCSYLTKLAPDGTSIFIPNYDFLNKGFSNQGKVCEICLGKGHIVRNYTDWQSFEDICPNCHGKGRTEC